jgi:hypothetical protein
MERRLVSVGRNDSLSHSRLVSGGHDTLGLLLLRGRGLPFAFV